MAKQEWYRRHTWTATDRSEFFARLARSRSAFHKAQYVRIQAAELHQAGGKPFAATALELLDMILVEWKADAQVAAIHKQRAECLHDLGDTAEMISAYRAAFDEQRRMPYWRTTVAEDFAWWVALSKRQELFDEAIKVVDEFALGTSFPVSEYKVSGARAIMYDIRGDHDRATAYARTALAAAEAKHSGFRNHAKLGVVEITDQCLHETIMRLARS